MRVWSVRLWQEYREHLRLNHRRIGRSPSRSHAGSHCDGYRECVRRRRQIGARTLLTTNHIELGMALRRGPVAIGVDWGRGGDETVIFKTHSMGKTEDLQIWPGDLP